MPYSACKGLPVKLYREFKLFIFFSPISLTHTFSNLHFLTRNFFHFSDVMASRFATLKSILACLGIPVQTHTNMLKCTMPVPPILAEWRVGPPPKNYHPGFCKDLQVRYGPQKQRSSHPASRIIRKTRTTTQTRKPKKALQGYYHHPKMTPVTAECPRNPHLGNPY